MSTFRPPSSFGSKSHTPSAIANAPSINAKGKLDYYGRYSDEQLFAMEAALDAYLGTGEAGAAIDQALRSGGIFQGTKEAFYERSMALANAAKRYVCDRDQDSWSGLVQCANNDPASVLKSVCHLAQLDLEANAKTGTGFLVPYGVKNGKPTCSAIPGVRGMERLMFGSGLMRKMQPMYVRAQDFFEYDAGGDNDPVHKLCLHPDTSKPNPIVAAYCRAVLKDGTKHIVVLPIIERSLSTERSTVEASAKNAAFRACAREVARTYAHDPERGRNSQHLFLKLVSLEEENSRLRLSHDGNAEEPAQGLIKAPEAPAIEVQRSAPALTLPPPLPGETASSAAGHSTETEVSVARQPEVTDASSDIDAAPTPAVAQVDPISRALTSARAAFGTAQKPVPAAPARGGFGRSR
jgi:hypothetical protein